MNCDAELQLRSWNGYHTVSAAGNVPDFFEQIGTLRYTRWGLIVTVVWSLVGAFGFFLMSGLMGALLPVEFEKLGASNTFIAVFVTSIPYLFNMVITPFVSFQSDRCRSRWGRRIPFLLFASPFVTCFLILIGWLPVWCHGSGWLPENTGAILLAGLSIGYQFFFLIVASVIYYLFPDVIPAKLIGRFMAFFQMTGSLSGFLFSRWLLPLGETHLNWLFTWVGLFFLVTMLSMCRMVREGAYPAAESGTRFSLWGMVRTYFQECYSIPFYYSFFFMMALSDVSTVCRTMFNFLYAKNTLGLTYEQYGQVMSWGFVIGIILSLPIGILVDRIHALRVYALGLVLVVIVNLVSFFYVSDLQSFYVVSILLAVVYTIQGTATLPCFVAILPKVYYGQFCSANALLRGMLMALCGAGGGAVFDWLADYQYIYLWDFIFTVAAVGAWCILYLGWKKRGGSKHYEAPLPAKITP